MLKISDVRIHRVLDANFNRAKEGARVCEDICRFIYDNRVMTRRLKDIRHELSDIMRELGGKHLAAARDSVSDVGKVSTKLEMSRDSVEDVLLANLQRLKESVRVLEEMAKLISRKTAQRFKVLRYRIYHAERTLIQKF